MKALRQAIAGVAFGIAAVALAAPSYAATKMILSNDTQAPLLKGRTFEHLKGLIEKNLKGEIEVELHHNGTLYNQKTQVQGLQLGGAQLISPTIGIYSSAFPKVNALLLPFMFPSMEAIQAAVDDPKVGGPIFKDMDAKNIKIVAVWANGPRNVGSKKKIITPADIQGVKIRVQPAEVFIETFKDYGANPISMSWGEVPTALEQGVIDAIEVTPNAWLGSGVYEFVEHITKIEYVISFYGVATNKTWWNGLPDKTRAKLKAAIDETTRWNWENAQRINEDANKKLIEKGVQVHDLTPAQRKEWRDKAAPVWRSIGYKLVGEAVVKRMQEISDKYAK